MGQQQLILLVLATVIVGIAIVVGIRAFTENSAKANADAMTQVAVRIANDAQAWKKKPAPFGGQASTQAASVVSDSTDFSGATWAGLGYAATGANYASLDGTFVITSADDGGLVLDAYNPVERNHVTVTVTGVTDRNITGTIICLGGSDPTNGSSCDGDVP